MIGRWWKMGKVRRDKLYLSAALGFKLCGLQQRKFCAHKLIGCHVTCTPLTAPCKHCTLPKGQDSELLV